MLRKACSVLFTSGRIAWNNLLDSEPTSVSTRELGVNNVDITLIMPLLLLKFYLVVVGYLYRVPNTSKFSRFHFRSTVLLKIKHQFWSRRPHRRNLKKWFGRQCILIFESFIFSGKEFKFWGFKSFCTAQYKYRTARIEPKQIAERTGM